MKRVFNFSPGPAMLPEPVLRTAQAELLDWQGSGMSVMEVSHRGTDFIEFAAQLGARRCASCSACPTTTRCCSCKAAPRCSSRPCR